GCWRAHLSTLLNAASLPFDFVGTLSGPTNCGIPFDADHEGHSGFKATGIVGNDTFLPSWLRATRPDVVMMLLGTNDVWGGGITAEEILKAYEGLVGDMRTENDDMRILIAQLPPMRPSNCADCYERVKELNRAIMAWVPGQSTPRSRITVVDAWTPFNTTEDMRDGVHPNE
ncbi:carbohydrate esterase family 3 protein, partial [Patellaria atrata CBS 101060]